MGLSPRKTIAEALKESKSYLESHGIEAPMAQSRLLLSYVLDRTVAFIIGYPTYLLTPLEQSLFLAVLKRRAQGEPPSKIMGEREFWSRPFFVNVHVLDPRPDSETLIEAVEHEWPHLQHPRLVLELGLGSGCLLLTLLLNHPTLKGVGVDKSYEALACAKRNVERHHLQERVSMIQGDWASALVGPFDLIISNPPYIKSDDMIHLGPELRFDPDLALDGGRDGLDCYRVLATQIKSLAHSNTQVFLEIGAGQAKEVQTLFERENFHCLRWVKDLAGLERVGVFQLK